MKTSLGKLERIPPLRKAWAQDSKSFPEISVETSVHASVKTSAQILALLKQSPTSTARQLAPASLGSACGRVELQLAKLKADNKLKRVGPNRGGHLFCRAD